MRSDIVPGGTFPDYELPVHTRTLRRLGEIQGEDPIWNRRETESPSAA